MKGKYAARASLRREDQEVRSDIETYQRTVARLTEENKDLREQLRQAETLRRTETRRLRAERDEGLSPELAALRRELNHQRERADKATAKAQEARQRLGTASGVVMALVANATGCTGFEAAEFLARALGGWDRLTVAGAGGHDRDLGTTGVQALQRARGGRSPQHVVAAVDALAETVQRSLREMKKIGAWSRTPSREAP